MLAYAALLKGAFGSSDRIVAKELASPGSRLEVVDRDGTVLSGTPALAFALSRLPLTAWFALPTLVLPGVRRARRA